MTPTLLAYALLPATFLCPLLDSRREPFFDLASVHGDVALFFSMCGGRIGAPIIGFLLVVLLVSRPGIPIRRRKRETMIIGGLFILFAGGGAWLNENALKPAIGIPRPNIVWLAGENGQGPLKMTPETFYAAGGKPERRMLLQTVLNKTPQPVSMDASIREHWIHEVGFAFPSGHAFASMFFATFFPALAAVLLSWRRRWIFALLPFWAVIVCWSRLVLRVHTPIDITAGGMEGISIGLLAFLCAEPLLRVRSSDQNHI